MTKLTLAIPALTGGVSTQPEPLRLPQQAEHSENVLATVIDGLRTRPPAEFVKPLLSFPAGPSVEHAIKSTTGNYLVSVTSGAIKVYDVAGDATSAPLTVVGPDGQALASSSYLATSDPQRDLRFLTLADYTVVLNRSKTVLASSTMTEPPKNQALVAILAGAYAKYYRIKVSHQDTSGIDVRFETHSSDGTDPAGGSPGIQSAERSVQTQYIAESLVTLMTTAAGPVGATVMSGTALATNKWRVRRSGSVIQILRVDGSDFTITIEESVGTSTMSLVYKQVQLFSDLPNHAPVGMKVEVIGDPATSEASYWVEFEAELPTVPLAEFANGTWRESVGPGISEGVDPATMPHALLRQTNGTWRFAPLDGHTYLLSGVTYTVPAWEPRTAGDDTTNKHPSFVGKQIRDLCFHEGRLGLLGEDGLLLSEARQPFSLYRTTVVDVLASEQIELKIPTVHAERLSHSVPLGGDIVLFSEAVQYLVRSEGPFAPNSVSMIAAGRHDCNPDALPIPVRSSLMVPSNKGDFGSVQELKVSGDQRPKLDAMDVTSNVPGYVKQIRALAASPQLEMLVATSAQDVSTLWVYTQFHNGDEKLQQAWQTFTFPLSPEIRHVWLQDTSVFLAMDYDGDVEIQELRMDSAAADPGFGFLMALDRRVKSTDYVNTLLLGKTTVTLPYEPSENVVAIEVDTGKAVRVVGVDGLEVLLAGDQTETDLWIGEPFEWRHELTKVHLHDDRQVPVAAGDLRLDTGAVYYSLSGPFEVAVVPDVGAETVAKFTGPYLAMGANYQKLRVTSGCLKFPVRARASEARVLFRGTSPWPVRLVSVDFIARLLRGRGARR